MCGRERETWKEREREEREREKRERLSFRGAFFSGEERVSLSSFWV